MNKLLQILLWSPFVAFLSLWGSVKLSHSNLGASAFISDQIIFFQNLNYLTMSFIISSSMGFVLSYYINKIFKLNSKFYLRYFSVIFIFSIISISYFVFEYIYWIELINKVTIFTAFSIILINFWILSISQPSKSPVKIISIKFLILIFSLLTLYIVLENTQVLSLQKARKLEHKNKNTLAVQIYENGLKNLQKADIRTKVKFHLGMLYYRLGDFEKAQVQWQELILEFSTQDELVQKVAYFESRLNDTTQTMAQKLESKRIILDGVKLSAVYKSAYCVPNTMEQMFRVWNSRTESKESQLNSKLLDEMKADKIAQFFTIKDKGTPVSMAVFLAEKMGFELVLQARSSITIIKRLIEHNYPVMAFFQGHVVMIFGYDKILNSVVLYDTDSWELISDVPIKDFQEKWSADLSMLGVLAKNENLTELKLIMGNDVVTKSEALLYYMIEDGIEYKYNLNRSLLSKAAQMGEAEAIRKAFVRFNYLGDTSSYYDNDSIYFKKGVQNFRIEDHIYYLEKLFGADSAISFIQELQNHKNLSWDIVDVYIKLLDNNGYKEFAEEVAWSEMDEDGMLGTYALERLADYSYNLGNEVAAKDLLERIILRSSISEKIKPQAMNLWLSLPNINYDQKSTQYVFQAYLSKFGCLDQPVVDNFLTLDTNNFDDDMKNLRYRLKMCKLKDKQ